MKQTCPNCHSSERNLDMRRHIQVSRYYQEAFISNEEVVLKQLRYEGINIDRLNEDDLMRFDQFDHVGQIKNTRMLADIVHLKKGTMVLDVGGGMGGAARYLAHKHGCRVHVIDLVPDRCFGGLRLTRMSGLVHTVSFHAADALQIPFRNEIFHLVWSQDAFDGISDKELLLKECRRVLKPNGELIFTDHLKGPTGAIPDRIYLWPEDVNQLTFEQYRELLKKTRFKLLQEIDLTEWAINSIRQVNKAINGTQSLHIHEAQGGRYYEKLIAFLNSFTSYLESGAIQYGAFWASCE